MAGAGEGETPLLVLGGFTGPLDHLLALARSGQIDPARVPLAALAGQLAAALRQAPATTPLGRKGDWVVMACWLVQLRARRLLQADPPAQPPIGPPPAARHAPAALAAWLERRPQPGREVFCRGRPELPALAAAPAVDVIEFLWASLDLFDDAAAATTAPRDRPRWPELHSAVEARARILERLEMRPEGGPLGAFLPPPAAADTALRRRSAWTSTFIASLELARQGAVLLEQAGGFAPLQLRRPAIQCETAARSCRGAIGLAASRHAAASSAATAPDPAASDGEAPPWSSTP